jgi:polyisoprenoid-binding protein YceI
MKTRALLAAALLWLCATPLAAQPAPAASAPAAAAITAGTYKLDPDHTQVVWSVDHMGLSRLFGMVGQMTGSLQLDPARPSAAALSVEIPISGVTVTSAGFSEHLRTPDLLDAAKFPTARFVSRSVAVHGEQATITGDLTLRGVTKPVTLEARLHGAGTNAMSKRPTIGFDARAQIKRSDFGLGYGAPLVSDQVDLQITAAFEK